MQIARVRASTYLQRTFGIRIDDIDLTAYFAADWSTTHDVQAAFAVASLTARSGFMLDAGSHTVRIYAGWFGQNDLVFSGEIVTTAESYFPQTTTLTAGGYLKRLDTGIDVAKAFYYAGGSADDTQALLDQIGSDYQAVPILTDADLIIHVLETYGITPQSTNHSIEASSWVPARIAPIVWETGQPGWSIIQEIDNNTTHRTYDGRTGAVYRRQVLSTVPTSTRHTFQQGADILNLELQRDFRVYNQCIVRGAMIESTGEQVEGISPVGGPAPSPYIPAQPGVRTDETINSAYIETIADAQLLADIRLGLIKQPLQTFALTTFGCADIDVGDALRVETDRLQTNAFVIGHTITGDPHRSTLTLRGSTVAEARPNQPPIPALTYTTIREQVVVSGTDADLTIIQLDATASSDTDGTIAAYSISINGTTYPTATATHPHIGPAPLTATVTVTDNEGLSATLEQQIDWTTTNRLIEPIHAAEATQAEATIDGDRTWRSFSAPVTAVAPIALGSATIYGCSDGKLYRSTDDLATAPQLVATLPSAVNCLWNNELLTGRWLAGLSNGDVWLSIDEGLTWSKLYTFAAAVNDLAESPYAANQISACSGPSFWTTFDGLSWSASVTDNGPTPSTALRFAAGPFAGGRAWVGYANGLIRATDGTTITLPTPAAVRGLTLARLIDELYIFTDSTATYRWSPAGGLASGATTGTATNRAIRSGIADFVYTAEDGAIGKWFPSGSRFDVRLMTTPQQALAVGYRGLIRPSARVEVLIPTYGAALGGLYRWASTAAAPTFHALSALNNRYAVWLAADEHDGNRLLLLINSVAALSSEHNFTYNGGNVSTNDGTTAALWLSTNGGTSWTPVALSTSGAGPGPIRIVSAEWSHETPGAWFIAGFNGDGTTVWRGTGAAGSVVFTHPTARLQQVAAGLDDDIVFGNRDGLAAYLAGSNASLLQGQANSDAIRNIERLPGDSAGVVGLAFSPPYLYGSSNYRTQAMSKLLPAPVVAGAAGGWISAATHGVYAAYAGLSRITTPLTTPAISTPIADATIFFVRVDRQQRSNVLARCDRGAAAPPGYISTNGTTWIELAPPSGSPPLAPIGEIVNRI